MGLLIVAASAVSINNASAEGLLQRLWDRVWGHKTTTPVQSSTPTQQSNSPATTNAPLATSSQATQSPEAAQRADQARSSPTQPLALTIPVVLPKVQTVGESLEVTGNAEAVNQVKLLARVTGYLEQIHFQDGAFVKNGDLLFIIQQDQYKAQLQQAQAQLQAQEVLRDHARLEVARYTALLRQHATSQVEVDHWVYEEKTAEANILAAQAQVAIAKLNLSYTEVKAPFDGQMGKHFVDPGNVVGGNGQQPALAEITQLDPIYVVANISQQQALVIRANLDQRRLTLAELHQIPVEAALSDETGFPHRGTIQYVAPAIDPATGTLYVRGVVPNLDRSLLPGMFVNIRLPLGKVIQSALLAPVRALQEDQGGRYLFVVGDDGIVQKRYVQLGQVVGDLQVVTGGLGRNDQVVVGELWRVTSGMKIAPKLTTLSE
jgi:RND family efflux transporter MFP subunit